MKGKDKAVLMAFNEADGKFLWQIVHDIPDAPTFQMVLGYGLLSTPAIDGDRIYYVTPSCEVICAGADDGKVKWRYDMMKELKVVPFHCGNCSPLVVGDRVFLVTSNGNEDGKIASPKAPSFIALDKHNGTLALAKRPARRRISSKANGPIPRWRPSPASSRSSFPAAMRSSTVLSRRPAR